MQLDRSSPSVQHNGGLESQRTLSSSQWASNPTTICYPDVRKKMTIIDTFISPFVFINLWLVAVRALINFLLKQESTAILLTVEAALGHS